MSLDRILRSFSHSSCAAPSNTCFFADDAVEANGSERRINLSKPPATLQRLCLFTLDENLREYRTQIAWRISDLRPVQENIIHPRPREDRSGCDKMMPFGQKLATRAFR
jgi:hypothetical protein